MPILLALFSAVVYGVSDYCGGRASRSSPTFVVVLVGQTTTVVAAGLIVAISGDPIPGGADVAWSAASGLASLVGVAAFYRALASGAMTVVAPLTAVVSALVPVVTGVALGERPSAIAMAGVGLAIVAVALVSGVGGRADRPTPTRVAALAVLAGAGFGLLFVFLDRTSDGSGAWPLLIAQLTAFPIVAGIVLARHLGSPPPRRIVGLMVLAGLLAVSANLSYLAATRQGLLSLVAVITSLYPASTVALATILDHERMRTSQAVGLAVAVTALALVTVGS